MPGIEKYREPSEQEVKEYLAKSNPEASYNNIWIFIFAVTIFILTIISLEMKSAPKSVYVTTKTMESLMMSSNIEN